MNTEQSPSPQHPFTMLLVSDTVFDTNGVSRFIQDMAVNAKTYGTDFTVITASPIPPEALPENILNLKPFLAIRMPFYKEQFLNIIPPFFTMLSRIRTLQPEIIHISTPGPLGWSAWIIARLLQIPTASTYHTDFSSFLEENTGSKAVRHITSWVMRRFYRRMVFTFSRSRNYIDGMHQEIGIPKNRIVYLRPGTDTQTFNPKHRQTSSFWHQYGIKGDPLILLYVGRLNVEKNVLFLIEQFKTLRSQSDQELALVLVGEGEYSKFADIWHLDNIHCLGVKRGQELSELYASSDLFLSASFTETLGQNIMEAHASGLPAIVTDQGGVLETVVDQQTGFTLSVDAPERWVMAMQQCVDDDTMREAMGQAAYERMQQASILKSCEAFIKKHQEAVTDLSS